MKSKHFAAWWLSLRQAVADVVTSWRGRANHVHPAIIVAVAGLALSFGAYLAVARYWDRPNLQFELDTLAEARRLLVQSKLDDVEETVDFLAGFFQASTKTPDRLEFAQIIDRLRRSVAFAGIIDWVPRVTLADRIAHENSAAREGFADYRISDIAANGALAPAADRDTYFPLLYTSGTSGQLASASWAGLDLGANATIRRTLDRARDQNALTGSGFVWLTEDHRSPPIFILASPVYVAGWPHDTAEERRQNLAGFIASIVDPGVLLDSILRLVKAPQGLDIQFLDPEAGPTDMAFHVRSSLLRTIPAVVRSRSELEAGWHATRRLQFGGAQWDMMVVTIPHAPLFASYNQAKIALIVGLILTCMTVTYVWLAHGINTRMGRTREQLAFSNRLLHAVSTAATELVTNSSLDDAIVSALKTVGEAVYADRVLVLEAQHSDYLLPPTYRYGWQSTTALALIDSKSVDMTASPDLGADPWFAPLRNGKAISARLGEAGGAVKWLLETLCIKSLLVLPLMVDGKYWGQIGFDDCQAEREWSAVEIDILRTLADIVGTAIIRAQYVRALSDANRIVQNSPTVLYRLAGEPALPMVYVSHNITLFGHDPDAMVASPQLYKSYIHPDDQEEVQEAMGKIVRPGSKTAVIDFRFRDREDRYRWVENRYTPVRDAAGRLVEIEGILIDITERKAAEEKIALLARTDALTGLANRTTFAERLRQVFAAARRGGSGFAVFYLDLDHFKDINDTLGHPAGDLLLKAVAKRLKGSIRETDLVARLGGDEFAVLQTDLSDIAGAGELATKVRSAVAAPYIIDGSELRVTTSVGISPYAAEIKGPDDMLAQADLALYRAKEEGRDQYRFHSEALDHQVRERVSIADDLRRALDHGELELYYQPQVELASGQIAGMEALIRWNHPTRGLLLPAAFLPIAERSGSIVPIGQWVLDHACQQMNSWRQAGLAPATLAVNLSLAQLKTGRDFVEELKVTLTKWGMTPNELELDVTEAMLARATPAQNDVLDRLQQLGVQIAIDEFGTQYSSLDYLKTYHVSRLKVPQAMVASAATDPRDAAMMRAIVGIARELAIEVVAQGVETEAQRSILTAAATTTKAQGFYYSKPVPAARAAEILRAKRISPCFAAVAG